MLGCMSLLLCSKHTSRSSLTTRLLHCSSQAAGGQAFQDFLMPSLYQYRQPKWSDIPENVGRSAGVLAHRYHPPRK
ncbi:uncharacterized protein BO66DRAFT_167813 [Aspergillus aculeatinus CBS 121060]|uniref:Uncharacterized protein n=1 Tax=Aspergillus aculeatinus CBS 121060 TaxID=1448322 RepID=A0ACD1GZP4_9EURO|nr:hypothetical protein BO66DRAFT_167813 [Aspergillus aculeatinus CBS 121060]RAH66821.1 hypothetical protein BO66DRAFT_167813 [Aspergillus aculeatinus CBS 121060]